MLLTSQTNGLELYQLLAGRDFCKRQDDGKPRTGTAQMAAQMSNFVYAVHDHKTNHAVLIDPCWDIDGILESLSSLGIPLKNIDTCAYTHHHFDHTGGHLPKGYTGGKSIVVPGIKEMLNQGIEVAAGKFDIPKIATQCHISPNSIRPLNDGDNVWETENVLLKAWHTPGHTAGSMTFVAYSKTEKKNQEDKNTPPIIVTGDTLFIGSCGRYDLPDSNINDMVLSLERLSTLPTHTIVCPGHNYATTMQTTIGQEQLTNQMMQQCMKLGPELRVKLKRQNTKGKESNAITGSGGYKNEVKQNKTSSASAITSYIPLPDYLGTARKVLKSHVQWEQIHDQLKCFPMEVIQYEPKEASL